MSSAPRSRRVRRAAARSGRRWPSRPIAPAAARRGRIDGLVTKSEIGDRSLFRAIDCPPLRRRGYTSTPRTEGGYCSVSSRWSLSMTSTRNRQTIHSINDGRPHSWSLHIRTGRNSHASPTRRRHNAAAAGRGNRSNGRCSSPAAAHNQSGRVVALSDQACH
jgi:hypothetical protein